MPRLLLVLPTATYRAADFVAAARALGADLVVATDRPQALRDVTRDRAVVVDLERPEAAVDAIVELAARAPLDAVVAADEAGVVVAALAADRLGLVHNRPEAVAATRDKAVMRRALAAAGVAQPEHRVAGPDDDVAAVAAAVGLPCVIKPLSLAASRGVIRADDPSAALAAAARVRAIVAEAGREGDGRLLVERYIPGDEVAVEAMVGGGTFELLALFDKPDPLEGPFFEETIYVTPSRLPAATVARVTTLAAEAVAALGLREGPVHAEVRVRGEQAWVLEVAARSIGGLCSRCLRFGIGVSLEEVILRHALGLPLGGLARQWAASGVMMVPIPRGGTLTEVRGLDAARSVPGVAGVEITVPPGRPVRPLPEGDRYLGFLFARSDTPAEVEAALRTAHGRLDVVID